MQVEISNPQNTGQLGSHKFQKSSIAIFKVHLPMAEDRDEYAAVFKFSWADSMRFLTEIIKL